MKRAMEDNNLGIIGIPSLLSPGIRVLVIMMMNLKQQLCRIINRKSSLKNTDLFIQLSKPKMQVEEDIIVSPTL